MANELKTKNAFLIKKEINWNWFVTELIYLLVIASLIFAVANPVSDYLRLEHMTLDELIFFTLSSFCFYYVFKFLRWM